MKEKKARKIRSGMNNVETNGLRKLARDFLQAAFLALAEDGRRQAEARVAGMY